MKNILVPTDFSRPSGYALKVAIALAQQTQAKICLMHVLQSLYEKEYNASIELSDEGWLQMQDRVQRAEEQLQDILQAYHLLDDLVTSYVKVGSVFEDITPIIARSQADIIIMGTKGDKGLHAILAGSNAEKVVRYARNPVLTVPQEIKNFRLRNVFFATTFDEHAAPLLHLLYINTPSNYTTTAKLEANLGGSITEEAVNHLSIPVLTYNIHTPEQYCL